MLRNCSNLTSCQSNIVALEVAKETAQQSAKKDADDENNQPEKVMVFREEGDRR